MGLMQKLLYVIKKSHGGVYMCETLGSLPSIGEREIGGKKKLSQLQYQ